VKLTEDWGTLEVLITERNDYIIHLKYAHRLSTWSQGLSISSALTCHPKADLKLIEDKAHLMSLTRQSMKDELAIVMADADYSLASVLWLPSKSYYLLYHMVCVIEYIVTGDPGWIRGTHKRCLKTFSSRLRNNELVFNYGPFNRVLDKGILDYRSASGEILQTTVDDDVVHQLVMKKVANYKIDDEALFAKINKRTKAGKKQYEAIVNKLEVSILDFFYSMRIKSSYKNFSFIDGIEADGTKRYFEQYYELTDNFYECLNNLKNDVITAH
jgi:hypothetical protein